MKSNELFKKTLAGLLWVTGSTLINSVLRIAFVAVIARILSPEEFGLMATGMLIVKFSELIAQMGVGPALVQQKNLTENHIHVGFTLALMFGFGLCGLFLILNPFIAVFFRSNELKAVLDILCLAIPIRMVTQVSYSILQREMMFKRLASIDVISYLCGYGLSGILFALNGFGVMSLVYAVLIQSVISSALLVYYSPHKVKLVLRRKEVKGLLVFGFGFTLSTILNFFARNGDTIIISRYIGVTAVGIYDRAYVLMNVANNVVGKAIGTVMFPAFSKLQADKERRDSLFTQSLGVAFGVLMPMVPLTYILAEEIVLTLLGPKWLATVMPFQILCFFLVFRVVYKICASFLKGMGQVYVNSIMQFFYMLIILVGSYMIKERGIEGVAAVVGLGLLTNFLIQFIYIGIKNEGIFKKVVYDFMKSLPLSFAVLVGLYIYKNLLSEYDLPSIIVLIGGGLVLLLMTLLLWSLAGPNFFNPHIVAIYEKAKTYKRKKRG